MSNLFKNDACDQKHVASVLQYLPIKSNVFKKVNNIRSTSKAGGILGHNLAAGTPASAGMMNIHSGENVKGKIRLGEIGTLLRKF